MNSMFTARLLITLYLLSIGTASFAQSGPVAWYSFDTLGTPGLDSTANALHGAPSGTITSVAGVVNSAAALSNAST